MQTIGDIATVLGHESRNLFGALKTCLSVLRANPNLSHDDRELLDIIEAGARRLGDVMADFAIFSRTAPPHIRPFFLHELIAELCRSLQERRPALELTVHLAPELEEVRADRDLLRQALWHLFWNGVQAAGPEGKLVIETAATNSGCRIMIHDSGPGIPSRELGRIFEPLYTTKPRSAGLGLAVARRVMERHHGRLQVKNRPGAGACFIVDLPAKIATDRQARKIR